MPAIGCTPGSLEDSADQTDELRKHIVGCFHDLNWQVQNLSWGGEDAEDLRITWHNAIEPQFNQACILLQQLERTLRYNASSQRQASSHGLKRIYWFAHSIFQKIYGTDEDALSLIDLEDPTSAKADSQLPKKSFYGAPVFSDDGPTRADVNQGALGDCYLMAAMSSLASTPRGRKRLQEMIRDNGDGTYTVLFEDRSSETIDGDFFVGRNSKSPAYAQFGAGGVALWPMILEKGYAQRNSTSYERIKGGNPTAAMQLLGGEPTENLKLQSGSSRREITQAIDSANTDGRALVAAGGGHAWTVVATDGKTVELYNPWGDNSGWSDMESFWKDLGIDQRAFNLMSRPGGRLMVPIDHFSKHWDYIGYEAAPH